MATTYTVTHSFIEDTTAFGSQVNQNFTDILTAINALDASNLASSTVPLARISGLTTTQFASNVVDTDDTLTADSDTRIPSQSAVHDYVVNTLQAAVGATTISPTAYAAEESITFTNGLIIKQGAASYAGSALEVTFGTAFPTDCLSIQLTAYKASYQAQYSPQVTAKSTTAFTINHGAYTGTQIYWFAIGY